MKTRLLMALGAVMLLSMQTLIFAQAPPMGTAADFVLFSSVGAVTNVGTYKYLTYLTGNVGTNSGSSTNFGNVNGVMHDGDGASSLCASDLLFAYNSLSAAITDSTLGPVIGDGTTLKAKTYLMPGATSLNLSLTLDGQGDGNAVFIFKTPSDVAYAFTANPNSKIKLINGAKACNVFWQVSGAVNVGAGATIRGNIIAHGAISMGAQDTLEGRALTVNGAITVSNGALGFLAYLPMGCGYPVPIGPAAPTFVGLGSYAIFATTGSVHDCFTSHITGDVGGQTSAPTGFNPLFVNGSIHFNDPSTTAAAGDLLLIYNNLLGLAYDIALLDPPEFGHNLVLTPHVYQMNAAVTFTDTLFLNGLGNPNAIFIIKTFGAFATASGAKVALVNGTQAKNVYWFCTAAVSIGANSIFKGAIIAHDAIDILPGATLEGRAFSTNGAISTCGMTTSIPSNISSGPASQTVCVGSSVRFIVTASGANLAFQWRKGNVNLIDGGNISGATNDTLTLNPASLTDPGTKYNVIVYAPPTPNDTSAFFSLTVTPTVGMPTPITISAGVEPACILANGTTTTTYATTATNKTGLQWSLSNPAAGVIVDTTGLLTWANGFSGIVDIRVTASGCNGPSSQVIRTVNVRQTVGTPAFTLGATSDRCKGAGTVTYAATATDNTGITYSLDATSLTNFNVINASTGAVTFTANWVGVSTITATATGCSGPAIATHVVTVNPPPVPIITGQFGMCINSGYYDYVTEAGMTNYDWKVSPGGVINFGLGTNRITVSWIASGPQTVSVVYADANGCSNAFPVILNVTVNPLPGPIGSISGSSLVCAGSSGAYSVATISNVVSYNWDLPSNATIVTGMGTNSITVNFARNTPSGNIYVHGNNLCGNGTLSPPFAVIVTAMPEAPVVTNTGYTLYSSAATGNQWYFEGTLIEGATSQTYDATLTGTGYYWSVVTINDCSSDPSNHLLIITTGVNSHPAPAITMYPVPNDGRFTVSIVSPSLEPYTISVFTILGVPILELKDIHVNGRTFQVIDMRPAENGIYTVMIRNSSYRIVKKVVVSK